MKYQTPKFISRRAFLRRGSAVGAALALPAFAAACGNNDEATFTEAVPTTVPPTVAPTEVPTVAQAEPTTSEAESSETSTPEPASEEAPPSGPGPIAIDFTYTMGPEGKQLSPYLAVWVEDTDGKLVRTLELWVLQDEEISSRWHPDLLQWFKVDQTRIEGGGADFAFSMSSATRAPGSYSLLWDGLDQNGEPAPDSVVICIESARERGPYSLVCAPVERTDFNGPMSLANDGEISGVTFVAG